MYVHVYQVSYAYDIWYIPEATCSGTVPGFPQPDINSFFNLSGYYVNFTIRNQKRDENMRPVLYVPGLLP